MAQTHQQLQALPKPQSTAWLHGAPSSLLNSPGHSLFKSQLPYLKPIGMIILCCDGCLISTISPQPSQSNIGSTFGCTSAQTHAVMRCCVCLASMLPTSLHGCWSSAIAFLQASATSEKLHPTSHMLWRSLLHDEIVSLPGTYEEHCPPSRGTTSTKGPVKSLNSLIALGSDPILLIRSSLDPHQILVWYLLSQPLAMYSVLFSVETRHMHAIGLCQMARPSRHAMELYRANHDFCGVLPE